MELTYGANKRMNAMPGIDAGSIVRILDRHGECSVQSIANELGCSEGSVRSRIGTMYQCGVVACSGSTVAINSHAVKQWCLTEGFKNSAMYVAIVGRTDQ